MRSSYNGTVKKPTEEELKEFFREYNEEFRIPELRNFKHVFYKTGNPDTPVGLQDFLTDFQSLDEDFSRAGDIFIQGYEFSHMSFEQTALFFGRDFTTMIFQIPSFSWGGPIASSEGVHYVLVEEVMESRIPDFQDIAAYLQESYMYTKNREIQQKQIDRLRESYTIIIEERSQDK